MYEFKKEFKTEEEKKEYTEKLHNAAIYMWQQYSDHPYWTLPVKYAYNLIMQQVYINRNDEHFIPAAKKDIEEIEAVCSDIVYDIAERYIETAILYSTKK